MPVSSSQPPHDLQLVIDFVNTADLEAGTDELATAHDLGAWLARRGLVASDASVPTAAEHADAVAVRGALRAALLAHNGIAAAPEAGAVLERAAHRGQLSVRFSDGCSVGVAPRADGVAGALAAVLVPVAAAAADGSWERVKACRADDCQWAFYDASRNRSGRWCDMAVCGNRTKVRAYRSKQSGP
jgi:predicted RNA-binding Zn ribbon-like protein